MYVGDASTAYTNNFMKAQKAVEEAYGNQVIAVAKYNVSEGLEDKYFQELIDEKCDIIYSSSNPVKPFMAIKWRYSCTASC